MLKGVTSMSLHHVFATKHTCNLHIHEKQSQVVPNCLFNAYLASVHMFSAFCVCVPGCWMYKVVFHASKQNMLKFCFLSFPNKKKVKCG